MAVELDGTTYLSSTEVAEKVGVSRQTLWRWRQQELIPIGRRYRSRQVIFSPEEVQVIREYANRVEPIEPTNGRQLRLFSGPAQK